MFFINGKHFLNKSTLHSLSQFTKLIIPTELTREVAMDGKTDASGPL